VSEALQLDASTTKCISENARDLHASTATTFASFVEQVRRVEAARARREAQEQLERSSRSEVRSYQACLLSYTERGTADSPTNLQELRALQAVLSLLGAGLVDAHNEHFSDLEELKQSLNDSSAAFQGLVSTLRLEIARAAEEAAGRSRNLADELGVALQGMGSKVSSCPKAAIERPTHSSSSRAARHRTQFGLLDLS
jgi:hypothetical protein